MNALAEIDPETATEYLLRAWVRAIATDRANLADCRAKRLPISGKAYQRSMIRAYLNLRSERISQ